MAVLALQVHLADFSGTTGTLSSGLASAMQAEPMDVEMIDLGSVELPPTGPTGVEEKRAEEIEKKKEEAEKEEETTKSPDEVVVTMPRPEVEARPEETKHRSEFDSKVEHETVHRGIPVPSGHGTTGKNPDGVNASPEPPTKAAQGGKSGAPSETTAVGSQESAVGGGRVASSTGEKGSALGFDLGLGGNQPKRGKGLGISIDPGTGRSVDGEGGDDRPKTDLRPSGDALARAASGTYDNLEDIDEGEETLLNSKRFKYASFFNRVKRAVWENWHADRVYSLRDPDGRIYGIKDRLTVLKVSLRADGSLANVIVEKPCGVDFLDDEAVSAFKKAQPFPNPPKGLVDEESKLITFRFGFTLEIQDRPSWKIVRYQ